MTEYIEREAALEAVSFYDEDKIREIPAADVVPARHGSWCKAECFTVGNTRYAAYQCSVCYAMYQEIGYGFNYCPNCGAKMDKDGDGE